MELKHIKPLTVASIINVAIGAFLIASGLLEFTGILKTDADTLYKAIGVQLSYLVFISGILIFVSGGLTMFNKKHMDKIDFQIFIGVVSLAWPIFVSIALFFAEWTICLRLLPTMLSSLFYMITVLIVKIANEALRKTHKFNPSAQISSLGKRKQAVDVSKVFTGGTKKHSTVRLDSILGFFQNLRPKKRTAISNKILYSGSRRRRGGGLGSLLYSGGRRRGKFRLRK